jgi:hypothetical protein
MRLSRSFRWLAVAGLVVAPIGMATTVHAGDTEVLRIRTHFDSVLIELSARDLRGLSADQRSHRAALLRELDTYRVRGVFPHNYDFPDPTPYFVDRKTGTLCAVANLLARSGRRDIVDRVARANNNVWVAELAGDSAFASWLDVNGLTLEEAARIQVPYSQPSTPAQVARQVTFGVTGSLGLITAATTSLWNSTANSDGHSRLMNWTGVVSGTTSLVAAALIAETPSTRQKFGSLGLVTAGIGALSIGVSTHSFFRHSAIVSAQREAAEKRSVAADASISPIVTTNGATGVGVTVRF